MDPIVQTISGAEIAKIRSWLTGAVASSEAKGATPFDPSRNLRRSRIHVRRRVVVQRLVRAYVIVELEVPPQVLPSVAH